MVRFNRFLGCCLVGLFGLISQSAFAQPVTFAKKSQALAACSSFRADWASLPLPVGTASHITSPRSVCYNNSENCSQSGNSFRLSQGSSGLAGCYALPVLPSSYFSTHPYTSSIYSGATVIFSFIDDDPPEPECPSPTAPEFTGWKAPTANGSGEVCIDGCGASIALQAPPLPLFSGIWTGLTCTPSPSNTPQPVGDPNDPPCPPGDSQCSGTGNPSDPDAPPNTGGGGFQCDSPPVCNADGVTCSMLYQQWRGRCAAELADLAQRDSMDRLNDAVLGTNDRLDGVNDRLDGVNDRLDGVNDRLDTANGRLSDISDNTDRTADGVDGLRNDLATGWSSGDISAPSSSDWGSVVGSVHLGTDSFDSTGFGFPRSCPRWQDVSFNIGPSAITIPLSTFELHCAIFEWTGVLIMAFAAYYASRIILTG